VYEKSIDRPTKMNDLHFYLEGRIKVMSTIALNSTLINISETVGDRGLLNPMDHQ